MEQGTVVELLTSLLCFINSRDTFNVHQSQVNSHRETLGMADDTILSFTTLKGRTFRGNLISRMMLLCRNVILFLHEPFPDCNFS